MWPVAFVVLKTRQVRHPVEEVGIILGTTAVALSLPRTRAKPIQLNFMAAGGYVQGATDKGKTGRIILEQGQVIDYTTRIATAGAHKVVPSTVLRLCGPLAQRTSSCRHMLVFSGWNWSPVGWTARLSGPSLYGTSTNSTATRESPHATVRCLSRTTPLWPATLIRRGTMYKLYTGRGSCATGVVLQPIFTLRARSTPASSGKTSPRITRNVSAHQSGRRPALQNCIVLPGARWWMGRGRTGEASGGHHRGLGEPMHNGAGGDATRAQGRPDDHPCPFLRVRRLASSKRP